MEVFEFLIIFLINFVSEKFEYFPVQKYFLMQMSGHFLIVHLHKAYYFYQRFFLTDMFEHIWYEEVKNLGWVVRTMRFQDLFFWFIRHVM